MSETKPALPLTPEQQRAREALQRIDRMANLLDSSFRVPGTNFRAGIEALIGFIPGVGDVIGALLSAYVVGEAWRAEVPRRELLRMLRNVGLEMLVGIVPVLGDVFDVAYKANVRNANIARAAIERRHFPEAPAETPLWSQPRALALVTAAAVLGTFLSGVLVGSCF